MAIFVLLFQLTNVQMCFTKTDSPKCLLNHLRAKALVKEQKSRCSAKHVCLRERERETEIKFQYDLKFFSLILFWK